MPAKRKEGESYGDHHEKSQSRKTQRVNQPCDAEDSSEEEESRENVEQESLPKPSSDDVVRQVIDSAETSSKKDEFMKKLAGVDSAERAKQEATFSYNVISIIDPPLPFQNPFNPRPANDGRVQTMKQAFESEGLRAFSSETRIMIVIPRACVEPSCICSDPTAPPKPLVLSEEGKRLLKVLQIIGGQHRQKAVIELLDKYTKMKTTYETKITKKLSRLSELEETTEMEQVQAEIDGLKSQLSKVEESVKVIGPWGVTLLDKDLISHESCVRLARNRKVVAFVETDGERVEMCLKLWPGINLKQSRPAIVNQAEAQGIDKPMIPLMEDVNVLKLLIEQAKCPVTWILSPQWKISWLTKILLSPSGGLAAQVGILMGERLSNIIAVDSLLPREDASKYLKSINDYHKDESSLSADRVRWLSEMYTEAINVFMSSSTDYVQAITPKLIHALEEISEEFKSTSGSFGFNVPIYNNAANTFADKVEDVLVEHLNLAKANFKTEADRDNMNAIVRKIPIKITILLRKHPFQTNRLPLLTPTAFGAMAETLHRFCAGLIELVIWIAPLAIYFIPRGGTGTQPRGHTAWLFKEFESTGLWTSGRGKELPKDFALLISENLDQLAQLENDLANLVSRKLCSERPINIKKQAHNEWDTKVQELSHGTLPTLEAVTTAMADKQNPVSPVTGIKQVLDLWPLNTPSFNHYTNHSQKHGLRDKPKYAITALIEAAIVPIYRKELLETSAAAQFFRTKIQALLSKGLKPVQTRIKQKNPTQPTRTTVGYQFPDGLPWSDHPDSKSTNIGMVLQDHMCRVESKREYDELTSVISRMLKHKMMQIKPGDPEYEGQVPPGIANVIYALDKEVRKNIALQWTIKKNEAEGRPIDLRTWNQKLEYEPPDWQLPAISVWSKPDELDLLSSTTDADYRPIESGKRTSGNDEVDIINQPLKSKESSVSRNPHDELDPQNSQEEGLPFGTDYMGGSEDIDLEHQPDSHSSPSSQINQRRDAGLGSHDQHEHEGMDSVSLSSQDSKDNKGDGGVANVPIPPSLGLATASLSMHQSRTRTPSPSVSGTPTPPYDDLFGSRIENATSYDDLFDGEEEDMPSNILGGGESFHLSAEDSIEDSVSTSPGRQVTPPPRLNTKRAAQSPPPQSSPPRVRIRPTARGFNALRGREKSTAGSG